MAYLAGCPYPTHFKQQRKQCHLSFSINKKSPVKKHKIIPNLAELVCDFLLSLHSICLLLTLSHLFN